MIYAIIADSVAIICFFIARSIAKGNINLIHSYHTKKVKEKDKKPYCLLIAKGHYIIVAGLLISSVFAYLNITLGVLVSLFLGIIVGSFVMYKAQTKYNR